LFLKETLTLRRVAAIGLAFIGAVVVIMR
jgi:drug/metabolite transporter (DMT)-like permease